jgi:hypothetical protein
MDQPQIIVHIQNEGQYFKRILNNRLILQDGAGHQRQQNHAGGWCYAVVFNPYAPVAGGGGDGA